MSEHTRKHLTNKTNKLKAALMEKIARVNKEEDLIALNNVIDKYVDRYKDSLTPEEAFGDDWTIPERKMGSIIQGLRFQEGMTQVELAKALKGVKQANISAWEKGKEKIPAQRVEQLSKIFGTNILKLVNGPKKRKDRS